MSKKQPAQPDAFSSETAAEQSAAETVDPIVAEMDAIADELAQAKEQWLRLAAEYDNFRKRSQREREESYGAAKADTLKSFLPVLDNFERALLPAALSEEGASEFRKGMEMIHNQLLGVMAAQGAEPFGESGEPFDPAFHMAMLHEENDAFGENTVAEIFQRGWRLGDRVIRVATVKVAN